MSKYQNALSLIRSNEFLDMIMVGMVFQAREVFIEPTNTPEHEARLRMAQAVFGNPSVASDRMKNVIASDPEIAALGGEASDIPEELLDEKIAGVWTPFALTFFA